jgi:hypothetical protein
MMISLYKNLRAVATKRTPWLGICEVLDIDYEKNRVGLRSPQNGVSTSVGIEEAGMVFLPYTGYLDRDGNMIFLHDLLETSVTRAKMRGPDEVVFTDGAYRLKDERMLLFTATNGSVRRGSIYDQKPETDGREGE